MLRSTGANKSKSHAKKPTKVTKTSSRKVSSNNKKRIVSTKKRLMLEIPTMPTITEVGMNESITTFDVPTSTVAFSHPLPSVEVASHPLIPKPSSSQNQVFAVIDVNGSQHKVTKDDQIMVNHLKDVEVGEKLAFEHVYLLGGRDFTVLGKPWVPNVQVVAVVEQHTLLAPVTVWKFKPRTGYRKLNRSRDHVTILRIEDVITEAANEFIPQVQPLSMVQLNPMQAGGHTLQQNLDAAV